MIELSDTTIRLYRKQDGQASLILRSFLMVNTSNSFNLHAYLKNVSLHLRFSSGEECELIPSVFGSRECFSQNIMVYKFTGSGAIELKEFKNTICLLTMKYHVSFTGHSSEEENSISYYVPVIVQSTTCRL